MKQYKDLNLKEIREECELDFAHYTYGRGQCSCCYGPFDMPARYWKNSKKPTEVKDGRFVVGYEIDGKPFNKKEMTYILFKNADNGCGTVTRNDEIKDNTCVSFHFKDNKQKNKACQMLLDQLDSDYVLAVPEENDCCILILLVEGDSFKTRADMTYCNYKYVKYGERV